MNMLRGIALLIAIILMLVILTVFLVTFDVWSHEGIPIGIGLKTPKPTPPEPTPTATPSPALNTADQALAAIRQKGKMTVMVTLGAGPYTYQDSQGEWAGFEIDLVRAMVKRWEDELQIAPITLEFIGVTIPNRELELASNSEVDFLIGAFSETTDRCTNPEKLQLCTSTPHIRDAVGMLVNSNYLKPEDSTATGFCLPSLDNRETYMVYLTLSTAERSVMSFKEACKFTSAIQVEAVNSVEEAVRSVADLDRRVFLIDASVLKFYTEQLGYVAAKPPAPDALVWKFLPGNSDYPNPLEIHQTGKSGSQERYVVLVRRDKRGFVELIDRKLTEFRADNTYLALCKDHPGVACN